MLSNTKTLNFLKNLKYSTLKPHPFKPTAWRSFNCNSTYCIFCGRLPSLLTSHLCCPSFFKTRFCLDRAKKCLKAKMSAMAGVKLMTFQVQGRCVVDVVVLPKCRLAVQLVRYPFCVGQKHQSIQLLRTLSAQNCHLLGKINAFGTFFSM